MSRTAWADAPKASVIMPTYNRAPFLELTLASFTRQTERSHELVIVDDGSTDATPRIVEAYASRTRLKYIRQANAGRPAARNAALRAASGKVLIFSDDDRIVPPDFVENHLREFPRGDEPKVVLGWQHGIVSRLERGIVVAPHVVLALVARRPELLEFIHRTEPDGPFQLITTAMVIEDLKATLRDFSIPERFWRERVEPVLEAFGDGLEGFLYPWGIGSTGNLSVPRQRVVDVGGFDEGFLVWGIEDQELHYKLSKAGARTLVSRDACSYHQVHYRLTDRVWWQNIPHLMKQHDVFEVWLFVTTAMASLPLPKASEILRGYRELVAAGPSAVADELARVTRAYAHLVARTATAHDPPSGDRDRS